MDVILPVLRQQEQRTPESFFFFLNRILLGEDHDKVKGHLKFSSKSDAQAENTGIIRLRVPFS